MNVPSSTTSHIQAQRGLFTFHPSHEFFDMDDDPQVKANLVVNLLSHKYIEELLETLDNLGINQATIYPSYDGVGKYTLEGLKIGLYT